MSTPQTAALIAVLMLAISAFSSAQAPAPAPGPSSMVPPQGPSSSSPAPAASFGPSAAGPTSPEDKCMTAVLNMSDCLTFVETGSTIASPDKNCCPELAGLLDSNPVCLCELLGSNVTEQYGITLDVSRALKLPSICKISTPPTSLCSALGYPVGAPGLAPSPESSTGSMSPASSPTTGAQEKDGAASIAVSATSFFLGLAFTFLLTFF